MVPRGLCAADIGADRGELSYTLLEENICPKVILSDVSKHSLNRAVTLFNQRADLELKERADFRVGDGLKVLKPKEAPVIIMAGMGGLTVNKILEQGTTLLKTTEHLIIQAMGNEDAVRAKLLQCGFYLLEEDLIYEEDFYYPLLHAVPINNNINQTNPSPYSLYSYYSDIELKFGPLLLKNRHPLLLKSIEKEKTKAEALLKELASANQGEERQQELRNTIALFNQATEILK